MRSCIAARYPYRCDVPLYGNMSPSDAAVALRSLPRRWRGVLIRPNDEDADRPGGVLHRPAEPGGLSALGHASHATAVLAAAHRALEQVLVQEQPTVDLDIPPAAGDLAPAAQLEQLSQAAEGLAGKVEGVKGDQWSRAATSRRGEATSALDIVRQAVERAVGHLREADDVIARVKGRPPVDDDA
jgi:hypothetical protein